MIPKRATFVYATRLLAALALCCSALPDGAPARAAQPVIKIERGGQCVEPAAEMRRDHMNMILHQRDQTVRSGIRTSRHSLKNCIDCHADSATDSVLGKDGFCESCHSYAAVRVDCFECHSPSRRKLAGAAATPGQPLARAAAAAPGAGAR